MSKLSNILKLTLAMLGTALTTVGTVAPAAGVTTGLLATYLISPTPAQCNGSCAPAADWVCGLNGVNYNNKMYVGD